MAKPEGATLQFMQHMWELVHALDVRSKRMVKSVGVTGPQRLVIRLVGQRANQTASELAETLNMHPSTLTGLLARLEGRGLLARAVDAEDRRRARFSLTPGGKKIDRLQRGTVEAAVRRAIARVGDNALDHTRSTLGQLIVELEREDN
ncbi:MAG TPA: MarR family transcriptional regulator [Kofleriaceae bacterium]|jgi:DNA-binding MarR family transcriptional regulator